MKHTRKSKVTGRQFQALESNGLYQPGVSRQVARVVGGNGADDHVPGTHYTLDEIQHYQQVGRRLQARAVAAGLSGLFRGVLRGFARLGAGLARSHREAAAMRQLRALDDRLLADIGISRGRIPEVVAGLEARTSAEKTRVRPLATVAASRVDAQLEGCNDANARQAA